MIRAAGAAALLVAVAGAALAKPEPTMQKELETVAAALTREPITATELARAIAGAVTDQGSLGIVVVPAKGPFARVEITRQFRSDVPANVHLDLRKPVALADVVAAFGAHQAPPPALHPDRPVQVIFTTKVHQSATHAATLLASLRERGGKSEVIALTLRRDLVLPQ